MGLRVCVRGAQSPRGVPSYSSIHVLRAALAAALMKAAAAFSIRAISSASSFASPEHCLTAVPNRSAKYCPIW